MNNEMQQYNNLQHVYHYICSFLTPGLFFSLVFLLFDIFISFIIIIIFIWIPNISASVPEIFFVRKIQQFLESFLFRVEPHPLIIFIFLAACVSYLVIRIKRNMARIFFSKRSYLAVVSCFSLFFLIFVPFIIVPMVFYPQITLQERSDSVRLTHNLESTSNPLRRIGRFFGAFVGRGCSYNNISWSQTGNVLYFSGDHGCDRKHFAYDVTTRTFSQLFSLPENRSAKIPTEEELRFPDVIGPNYTIKNFLSPSGDWTALLISHMNFAVLQDIMLVDTRDEKLTE